MDLHDRRGVGPDRGGVVLEMGAVGGADLDQPAAGAGHDVGDAEGAADLDELAARDDDLAAGGQRRQHQQHGGGVVVDRGRRLRAGQAMQPGRDVIVALAAAAAREIVFQRGRRAHGRDRGLDRLLGQERAAEIGVQHGAGEIEDPPLRGLHQARPAAARTSARRRPRRPPPQLPRLASAQARRASITSGRPARAISGASAGQLAMRSMEGGRRDGLASAGSARDTGRFPKRRLCRTDRPAGAAWPYWPAAATPMRTRTSTADDDRPIISAILVDERPALSLSSETMVCHVNSPTSRTLPAGRTPPPVLASTLAPGPDWTGAISTQRDLLPNSATPGTPPVRRAGLISGLHVTCVSATPDIGINCFRRARP